jgi:hypothetical protein
MWYAILMAVGLSVGIGLMIWALTERKKRYEAEKKLQESEMYRLEAVRIAEANVVAVGKVKDDLVRADESVDMLYKELNNIKEMIVESGDSDLLDAWLLAELEAGENL